MDDEWEPSQALIPLTYTTLLFSSGLIYLSFPEQVNRYGTLACVTLFGYLAFTSSYYLLPDAMVEDIFCRTVLLFTAHMWHVAGSRASLTPGPDYNPQSTLLIQHPSPWHRGWKLLCNGRGIGTSWEIPQLRRKRIPPVPILLDKTDHVIIPTVTKQSRTWPIIRWAAHLILYYLLLCFWQEFRWTAFLDLEASDIEPNKEVFIRRLLGIYPDRVTSHELFVRLRMLINFILSDYLKLNMMHCLCAIISVSTGLDDPSEWPPFFGSLPVRTVRAFWAEFWHTLVYAGGVANAKVILGWIGISGKGVGVRFAGNWLVFAMSGALHGIVEMYLMDCGATRSLLWWLMQPLAFVLEEAVSQAWKNVMSRYRERKVVKGFEMVVGWMWVFAWFFWSVPKMIYPLYNCKPM